MEEGGGSSKAILESNWHTHGCLAPGCAGSNKHPNPPIAQRGRGGGAHARGTGKGACCTAPPVSLPSARGKVRGATKIFTGIKNPGKNVVAFSPRTGSDAKESVKEGMALLGELLEAVQVTAGGARPSERGEGYAMKQLARSCTRSLSIDKTRDVFKMAFKLGSAQAKLIRNGSTSAPVNWDVALDEAEMVEYTAAVSRQEAREEAVDVVQSVRNVGRKSPNSNRDESGDESEDSSRPTKKRGKRGGAARKSAKANSEAAKRLIMSGESADVAKAAGAKTAAAAQLGQPKGDWKKVDIACLASKDATMAACSAVSVFARALQEGDPALRRGSMPCFFEDYTKLGCTTKGCSNCEAMKALGAKKPKVDKAIIAHIKAKCDPRTLRILK